MRRPDGPALATIVDFGMHGTILDTDNELLTEDAAGGLEMVLEERFYAAYGEPILGMFVQAGGADAAPRGDHLGHQGIARAEMIGHAAAPAILEQWEGLEWRDDALLDVHSQRIDLTYAYFGYDTSDEFLGAPLGIPLPLPYTWGGWPVAGFRVHDPEVGPDDPITVRVPLRIVLAQGGVDVPGEHTVEFDAAAEAHVFDLASVGLDPGAGAVTVRAHLAVDLDPDPLEATVP